MESAVINEWWFLRCYFGGKGDYFGAVWLHLSVKSIMHNKNIYMYKNCISSFIWGIKKFFWWKKKENNHFYNPSLPELFTKTAFFDILEIFSLDMSQMSSNLLKKTFATL